MHLHDAIIVQRIGLRSTSEKLLDAGHQTSLVVCARHRVSKEILLKKGLELCWNEGGNIMTV